MADGTVRGAFELSADQPIRQLKAIRDTGWEADTALKSLGGAMDSVGGRVAEQRLTSYTGKLRTVGTVAESTATKVSASWTRQREAIDRQATAIEARVDRLQNRIEAYGRTRAAATVELDGFERVNAQLSELEYRLSRLDGRNVSPRISLLGAGGGVAGGGAGAGRTAFGSLGGFGGMAAIGTALLPGAMALGGGAASLIGSAGAGALGAGVVGLGGAGTLAAGGALTALIAKPANKRLTAITQAMDAQQQAALRYGAQSRQATVAQGKVDALLAATPQAAGAVRQRRALSSEFASQTAPAQNAFYGGVANVAYAARQALPTRGTTPGIARDAFLATSATAGAATSLAGFLASRQSLQDIGKLTQAFVREMPTLERSLANVFTIFEHLSVAAIPFFHEANNWVRNWTAGMAASSANTTKVQGTMRGLVNSAKDWAHLTGAVYRTLRDIFSAGKPQGDSMVKQLTHSFDRWDQWIQRNPQKVRSFFDDAKKITGEIASVIGHLVSDIWKLGTLLTPIFDRAAQFIGIASSLGPGGLALGGALAYGGYSGARGALGGRGPSAGALAGSVLLGSGGPAVRSAQRSAGGAGNALLLGGGVAAGSLVAGGLSRATAGEIAAGMTKGGAFLMGGATEGAAAVLARREAAAAARLAAMNPPGIFSRAGSALMGSRAGPLLGAAGAAGGGALAGAARFALPVLGITAALQALSTKGNLLDKGGSFINTATLGLVPRNVLHSAFGTVDAGASLSNPAVAGHMQGLTRQLNTARTPAQFAAVDKQLANVRIQFELPTNQRKKFDTWLHNALDTSAKNAGKSAANTWADAFAASVNRGQDPRKAVDLMISGMEKQLKSLKPKGRRAFAESTAAWVAQMEKDNPALAGPLEALMRGIVKDLNKLQGTAQGKMQNLQDMMFFFNGEILKGTGTTWNAISKALTDPVQVAQERMRGIFGTIQQEAIDALTSMGYSKDAAKVLVTATTSGGTSAKAAQYLVTGGTQGSIPSLSKTAPAGLKKERGGMIGGRGLLDTVPTPDGGMAAPGEAWIANRHTMTDISRATIEKFGKTAWQMITDESRTHSSPNKGAPVGPNRHARGGHATGGGSVYQTPIGGALSGAVGMPTSNATQPGYVYGYSKVEPMSRTDQGLDFTGAGPFFAIGSGTVTEVGLWHGWPGTGGLVYRLDSGQYAGQNVFAQEHVSPRVSVGQHVTAGQYIGDVLPGYPWLETGFANASSTQPLTPYNGSPDGTPMPGGIAFRNLMIALKTGGSLPANMIGGGVGGGAPQAIGALKAPRSGLRGVPGALADRASTIWADALTKRVNSKLGTSGAPTAGGMGGLLGPGGGRTVTASEFGGPGDPGTGSTGYRGDNLYQHPDSYAELNMGTALGGLPYMTPLRVTYGGKSEILKKRDIGAGGGGIGGTTRAIDLWFQAAQNLGFSGLGQVQVAGAERGKHVSWGGWNAKGGDFTTRGPTLFGAGERGQKEHVSITPAGKSSRGVSQVVVNFNGPMHITSDKDIETIGREVAGKILAALDHVGAGTSDHALVGAGVP